MSVLVKICGVTRVEDARAAAVAGADAVGVNLWPGSKRHVPVGRLAEVLEGLPPEVLRVGVFVDASRDEIATAIAVGSLDAVQLHGDEAPGACYGLPARVIKALRAVEGRDAGADAARYDVDWILLDAGDVAEPGGTGRSFPWALARGVAPGRLFLAGGLTPANVAEAIREVRPFAVDVATGVESAPGIKDRRKIEEFVRHAKAA